MLWSGIKMEVDEEEIRNKKYFPFKIGIISKRIINKSKSLKTSTIF